MFLGFAGLLCCGYAICGYFAVVGFLLMIVVVSCCNGYWIFGVFMVLNVGWYFAILGFDCVLDGACNLI